MVEFELGSDSRFDRIFMLVERCGVPGRVESIVIVTPRDCFMGDVSHGLII